ncbi:MAG: response regulator transcription factor [Anaerolineales bacterium]
MKAFLITADPDERDFLTPVLRHAGLEVSTSGNLGQVMAEWEQNWADLIVIGSDDRAVVAGDVVLVRANSRMPLIIITDPLAEAETVRLLREGADLVLARPVSPRLLAAYAQVYMRRSAVVPTFVLPPLESADITLDPGTRTVNVAGSGASRLTQLEFYLLYVLMTNRDQVIPTAVIVERVWGHSGKGDRELVRGLVSRLRRKIEPDPHNPRFVHTIPGVGYRFSVD